MIEYDKIELLLLFYNTYTSYSKSIFHREISKYYKRRGNHHNTIIVQKIIIDRLRVLLAIGIHSNNSKKGFLRNIHSTNRFHSLLTLCLFG